MDIRQIREHFGRVKPYYLKNETMRALGALVSGLTGAVALPGGLPTDVRGALRDAVQYVSRDELIKKRISGTINYQPGQEKALLALFSKLYKDIEEELSSEPYDVAAARKLRLDQALNQGKRSLEAGRVSEADEYFQQAVGFYRDETRLFLYIGRALREGGAAKRAVPYLRKGLELSPADTEMAEELGRALTAAEKGESDA